jgi:predicted nuclease of predicted toxin-antitoxin system
MRFVVDAQLPPALARALTSAGFPAVHVADIGLLTASDRAIWEFAASEHAAILTKDSDFAGLPRPGPSEVAVIWLRIGNTAREPLVQWLLPLMPEIVAALEAGEALVEIRR